MADIAPLRGIIYNKKKVGDMRNVVAPPYDVVTPEQQAEYHRRHPNNVMHVDLGPKKDGDLNDYDWHERAGYEFNRWLAEGVLVRHEKPAIYIMETDFDDPGTGERMTRHGFVCLLRLEEFGAEAKIRPHERTFSYHKAERLHHMEHVQSNLSQIFTVFPDERREALSIIQAGEQEDPLFDFQDHLGMGHRMWPVWDKGVISDLGELMRDKTIYIADGHHRYETALNYRRLKAEKGVKIDTNSPLNYLMVYLCAVSDPGLAILPAHRLIKRTLNQSKEELEGALKKFFEVRTFSFTMVEERSARHAFLRRLREESHEGNVMGVYSKLAQTFYLLKKRNNAGEGSCLEKWPELLRKLDTVVLTSLVFQEALGMTEADLDDAARISYSSKADEAIDRVNHGQAELAAILNPTRMEQVQDVAEAGLVMPRKSTFFYPKVTTGMVFNPVNPFEEIEPAV